MKKWIWILIILAVTFLSFIAVAPKLLSTQFGTQLFFTKIAPKFGLDARAERIDLNWLGPQKIENFQTNDGKFSFESLELSNSLFSLILFPNSLNELEVISPKLILEKPLPQNLPDNERAPDIGLDKTYASLPALKGALKMKQGKIITFAKEGNPIEINDIEMDYLPEQQRLHLKAHTIQNQVKGDVILNGSFGERIHLLAEVEGFPTLVLDELLQTPYFSRVFGEKLSIKVEGEQIANQRTVSCSVDAGNLHANLSGNIVNNNLVISNTSVASFTLTPELVSILSEDQLGVKWIVTSPATFPIQFKDGLIPLDLRSFPSELLRLQLETQTSTLIVNTETGESFGLRDLTAQLLINKGIEIKTQGEIVVPEQGHFSATFDIDQLGNRAFTVHTTQLSLTAFQTLKPYAPFLNQIIGQKAEILLKGTQKPSGQAQLSLDFQSPQAVIKGSFGGSSWNEMKWRFTGEKKVDEQWVSYTGENLRFEAYGESSHTPTALQLKNMRGRIYNSFIELNLKGEYLPDQKLFSIDDLIFSGSGKWMTIPPALQTSSIRLDQGEMTLSFSGKKQLAQGDLKIEVIDQDNRPQPLLIHVDFARFLKEGFVSFEQLEAKYQANLNQIPTKALDQFLPEGIDLSPFIGSYLTLDLEGSYFAHQNEKFHASLKVESPGLIGSTDLKMNAEGAIVQTAPTVMHWELTPLRYTTLMQMFFPELPPYRLSNSSQATITLPQIFLADVSMKSLRSLFSTIGVQAELQTDPLNFIHVQNGDRFAIDQIFVQLSSPSFSKNMRVDLKGLFMHSNKEIEGSFTAQLEMLNLWTPDGYFDKQNFSLSQDIQIANAPVQRFLGLLPMEWNLRQKTAALLGEYLNLDLRSQIAYGSGPIEMVVSSTNVQTTFPLYLEKGLVTLREEVKASVQITPAISENYLIDINPILFRHVQSDHPIVLYISPEGFHCPIWITSLSQINIDHAVLDIGRVNIQKGPAVMELLKFLKSRDSKDTLVSAWFTPIFMSFKNGSGSYERFDLLLGRDVHIAFWGKIDWLKGKVWMTLGIAPKTLQQKFNLIGLSKKDMFQVKMRGTTSSVELDWSSAYTRIGILVARLAGGHIGYIVGGVVEQLITVLGEEPTPPPTTQPFPWEDPNALPPGEKHPEMASPPSVKQQGAKKILEFLIP